ncbi:sugar transferase [Listeria kieliensis]|uniref:Bacterial sugar transferase domain-containing protein n=1 Tax=Listeria kieliensis TaxID=1621700 RepID=A0A3D8TTP2_9LIST|nr:sugar transferase [Listeria kieliensis]RDX02255.1 hypothetical protein UR08_01635 [Listeria kieliensis]
MNSIKTSMQFFPKETGYVKWKRQMGKGLSLIGLFVLAPIFCVIALVIKISERGAPVLFKQKRVGKNGQIFEMYKFRTMCVDAELQLEQYLNQNEATGAMFKLREDPRVTTIGRFLRKTSLDELPQLWNVVKGEMVLVGPRPALPREVRTYTSHEKKRLLVTPGCTGLWQVSGRSELSFDEMIELDLTYIQYCSFKLDAKIIAKTFLAIFRSKGAY